MQTNSIAPERQSQGNKSSVCLIETVRKTRCLHILDKVEKDILDYFSRTVVNCLVSLAYCTL